MAANLYKCGAGSMPSFAALAGARQVGYHPWLVPIGMAAWMTSRGSVHVAGAWRPTTAWGRPRVVVDLTPQGLAEAVAGHDDPDTDLVDVVGWHGADGERYLGVWGPSDTKGRPVVEAGLSSEALRETIEAHRAKGLGLERVSAWVGPDGARFAGIWRRTADDDHPTVRAGLDGDGLRTTIDEQASQGAVLVGIDVYGREGDSRYVGIWRRAEGDDRPRLEVGLSAEELTAVIEKHRGDGYGVSTLKGIDGPDGERFVGIWTRRYPDVYVQVGFAKDMVSHLADALAAMTLEYDEVPGTPFSSPDEFVIKDGVVEFMTDNPEISVPVQLETDTVKWSDSPVPEEVDADHWSWVMSNGKLMADTWLDAGQPAKGAVEMDGQLIPTSSGHWAAPATVEAGIERVSLGYAPLNVRAWTQGARYQAMHTYMIKARLNAQVLLVPVEVGRFRVAGTPEDDVFRAKTSAVVDGQSLVSDAWTNSWEGEIRTFARQLSTRAPRVAFETLDALSTPDSIFRQANIAFRLRSYEEFEVERKQTSPRSGEYLEDTSAFSINANLFEQRVMDENRAPALRIVVMDHVTPPESPIEATSNRGFAGISRGDFGTFFLAHEIAHVGGLGHTSEAKNLMNKEPYDVHLNETQITTLRKWAQSFRNQWG